MEKQLSLCDLMPGQCAKIKELLNKDNMRRRLLDIGLVSDTSVECVGKSPMGDPSAFLIRGAVVAIRSDDCKNIIINNKADLNY